MMEILFKIINKKTKKIIGYEYLYETSGEWMHKWMLNGKIERGSWRGFCNGVDQGDWLRLQYIGLEDSKGVKIFEGDIVRFIVWRFDGNVAESHLTGTIVYSEDNMSFQLKGVKNSEWERHTGYENDMEYYTPFSELTFDDDDFEVIGNIHDNPELLEIKT